MSLLTYKPWRPFDTLPHYNFMGWRRFWVIVSLVLSLLACVVLGIRGFNYGIDFVGGKLVQVQTATVVSVANIRESIESAGFQGVTIQEYGSPNEFLIRLSGNDPLAQQASAENTVVQAIAGIAKGAELRRVEFVGPQVGEELKTKGLLALFVATFAILFYVWVRFEFRYGVGAIAALVHDVILTAGVMSITNMEITLTVLAAILTLIGYSLNDTIVIFDRIRENRGRYPNRPLLEVINLSVNQTLARTFMTVSTVLLVLLSLFFFGGEVIHDFSFVLLVGTLFGTYSSVFVAGAVLYYLEEKYHDKSSTSA